MLTAGAAAATGAFGLKGEVLPGCGPADCGTRCGRFGRTHRHPRGWGGRPASGAIRRAADGTGRGGLHRFPRSASRAWMTIGPWPAGGVMPTEASQGFAADLDVDSAPDQAGPSEDVAILGRSASPGAARTSAAAPKVVASRPGGGRGDARWDGRARGAGPDQPARRGHAGARAMAEGRRRRALHRRARALSRADPRPCGRSPDLAPATPPFPRSRLPRPGPPSERPLATRACLSPRHRLVRTRSRREATRAHIPAKRGPIPAAPRQSAGRPPARIRACPRSTGAPAPSEIRRGRAAIRPARPGSPPPWPPQAAGGNGCMAGLPARATPSNRTARRSSRDGRRRVCRGRGLGDDNALATPVRREIRGADDAAFAPRLLARRRVGRAMACAPRPRGLGGSTGERTRTDDDGISRA